MRLPIFAPVKLRCRKNRMETSGLTLKNITKMKKNHTKTFALLIAVAVLMTIGASCEKGNGVYSPKNKISKVYREASYQDLDDPSVASVQDKYLYENWTWSDGLVQQIDHYDGSNSVWTEVFTYDEHNRVVKIEDAVWYELLTFEYEDGRISKSKLSYDGELSEEWSFSYENGKLTGIDVKCYYYDDEYKRKCHLSPLSSLGFDGIVNAAMTDAVSKCKSASKGTETVYIKFQLDWNKDNITMVAATTDGSTTTVNFEYDQYKNPKRGFNNIGNEWWTYNSANNILKMTQTYSVETQVTEYAYEYEKKYPVTVHWTTDEYGYKCQYTDYYEYE